MLSKRERNTRANATYGNAYAGNIVDFRYVYTGLLPEHIIEIENLIQRINNKKRIFLFLYIVLENFILFNFISTFSNKERGLCILMLRFKKGYKVNGNVKINI